MLADGLKPRSAEIKHNQSSKEEAQHHKFFPNVRANPTRHEVPIQTLGTSTYKPREAEPMNFSAPADSHVQMSARPQAAKSMPTHTVDWTTCQATVWLMPT